MPAYFFKVDIVSERIERRKEDMEKRKEGT
jgi:hypothetical protein